MRAILIAILLVLGFGAARAADVSIMIKRLAPSRAVVTIVNELDHPIRLLPTAFSAHQFFIRIYGGDALNTAPAFPFARRPPYLDLAAGTRRSAVIDLARSFGRTQLANGLLCYRYAYFRPAQMSDSRIGWVCENGDRGALTY